MLQKWLDEEEAKGYLQPSTSPVMSSFFQIPKKDGELHPIQEYHIINSYMVKNNAPIPNIKESTLALANSFIFSTFDIQWGYNSIHICDGDQWKAAIKTCFGIWEPMVMYFGLTNSPATFQTMMDHIFHSLIDQHAIHGMVIHIYMDNIIIGTSSSVTDHVAAIHDVLDLLTKHNLFIKLSKCCFHVPSVNYLGVILEKGVTCMDLVKNSSTKDWPTPTKVKDVCSFLGFCNFYHQFIHGFTHLACPLNLLTCKNTTWQWGAQEQTAFNTLKEHVTSEPILAQPDLTAQFTLEVNASGYVVGAVLLQTKDDRKLHPIEYYSSTLNEAE